MSKSALTWKPISPFESNGPGECQGTRLSARIRAPEEVIIHHLHQGKRVQGEANPKGVETDALEFDVIGANKSLSADTSSPVFCIAPQEWLLVSRIERVVCEKIISFDKASDAPCYSTNVSDRYSIIELSGSAMPATLARGSGVDLEGQCHAVGQYVQTRLFDRPVIIHKVSVDGGFDIYVDRSLSVQLWQWLFDTDA